MTGTTFGALALDFYTRLKAPDNLPPGVNAIDPYAYADVEQYMSRFFEKYFADSNERVFALGINPGRFGSGVTGLTFTDPVALENACGISNDMAKRRELSSEFIYEFINRWGGPTKFYRHFFLTAVSPLGFTNSGVNYNYYDDAALFSAVKPFIVQTLKSQLAFGARRDVAILFGTGKNKRFFTELNRQYAFFKKTYALEHPRFIMQYRRKQKRAYLEKYVATFTTALSDHF